MQVQQLPKFWRTAVLLGLGALALFALAACGGDNDAPAAGDVTTQAPDATATTEPTAIPAPTAATVREPPESPMTPVTVPEPGSDEAQIMAVLEKQVIAVNTADYDSFLETCTPNAKKLPTIAQLKFIYEENQGQTASRGGVITHSPQGYNVRNVEVKMLRAPFAQATFVIYDYEKQLLAAAFQNISGTAVNWTFEKVDGQWYSETDPC